MPAGAALELRGVRRTFKQGGAELRVLNGVDLVLVLAVVGDRGLDQADRDLEVRGGVFDRSFVVTDRRNDFPHVQAGADHAGSPAARFDAKRPNARPALDDFGHLGAIKQHADVVLGLYREEMYNPGHGVDGATELIVLKNRNGPTGFVDLYFYRRWMRFEDMLDPDR